MTDDTLEQNKAIMRRMLEAFNTGDGRVVRELLHPEIRERARLTGFKPGLKNAPVMRRVQTEIMREQQAFPDRRFTEEMLVAEGDVVILRWSMTGTHLGRLFGKPATGKQVRTMGTEFVRIKDGKIVEHDDDGLHILDMLWQLDLLDQEMLGKLKGTDQAAGVTARG